LSQDREDARRANLVSAGALVLGNPRMTDTIFGSSDTASAVSAEAPVDAAASATPVVGADDLARETSFGDKVTSGLDLRGFGLAGVGGLAGAAFGDSDLEKGLIGAGVPLAVNVGGALFSEAGGSVLDAMSSSLFPSLAGGLAAIFM